MSNVVQDIGKIWCRLFDHKAFVGGEITFTLQEFEEKRKENEVDNLFSIIENIADTKDSQIDKAKESIQNILPEANKDLNEALDICNRLLDLEETFKQDSTIETNREKRKANINKFMDGITAKYTEINSSFEARQQELRKVYQDLESKLFV